MNHRVKILIISVCIEINRASSMACFINTPNLAGESDTRTPAFSKAAYLQPFPFPPDIMAPACPIFLETVLSQQ
jgi:hypothetical protein